MEKDKLERFISGHREEFDYHQASEDVWRKLEKKLDSMSGRGFSGIPSMVYKIAAVFAVFALAWYLHDVYNGFKNKPLQANETEDFSGSAVGELVEARFYYSAQILQKEQELKLFASDQPEILYELYLEMKQLDSLNNSLHRDLGDNIANEQVIEAMIQTYRIKLQILDEVLTALKQSKSSNKTRNETNNTFI